MNKSCNNTPLLSKNTRNYLETYRCILDEMIRCMTHAGLCNSISHNFIVQMIPHHKAAIQMSENICKYTTNIDIEQIASRIIDEQTKSIANMEKILPCCSRKTNSEKDLCTYQKEVDKIFQSMFRCMQNANAVNSVDCNFLQEMIPHHEGAVAFAETALQYCVCPELKPILKAIVNSQKEGICRMREVMKCLCR